MPYAGDWYLWCLFALAFDVGYIAEPMVCYRFHELSMTTTLSEENSWVFPTDDLAVLWRVAQNAEHRGSPSVCRVCEQAIHEKYKCLCAALLNGSSSSFGEAEFIKSIRANALSSKGTRRIGAQVCAQLADELFWHGRPVEATPFYRQSLSLRPWCTQTWIKYLLLQMGGVGMWIRHSLLALRRTDAETRYAR
jgi:hypothetical protein